LLDLLFEQLHLSLKLRAIAMRCGHARIPQFAEQRDREKIHVVRWTKRCEKLFELSLHHIALDRLSVYLSELHARPPNMSG
jgi:hypothetical protein